MNLNSHFSVRFTGNRRTIDQFWLLHRLVDERICTEKVFVSTAMFANRQFYR